MSTLEILASIPCVGSLKIADTILRELYGRGLVIVPPSQVITSETNTAVMISPRADFAFERATHQLNWPDTDP